MKYLSPAIIISQVLLLCSIVQAHNPQTRTQDAASYRRNVDDSTVYSREDLLQYLTTRELVEELSSRLERRGLFSSLLSASPVGQVLNIGSELVGGLMHKFGHHKHHE
ncbi:hypothetical protein CVT24_013247 [Panaeolus cyanescens]|uniref:Uncharacterized protein n=1 Tax=Panaeolus cyanescens TaxID=181874 RepID=A0A409WAM0_9AGAR|nr:hypothetical protein CVT24_013247 [Panaeolus cyanescens]